VCGGPKNNFAAVLLGVQGIDPNKANGESVRPIHLACAAGNIELVKKFIAHQAFDVNGLNGEKMTALHVVAQFGFLEILQVVAGVPGVKFNEKDGHGVCLAFV
jgi:ankyrin repeat protein